MTARPQFYENLLTLLSRNYLAATALQAILFFGIAGRLKWVGAWVFVAIYLAFSIVLQTWGRRRTPELLKERAAPAANTKSWDRAILRIYFWLGVGLRATAALDAGRFRWSTMSPPWQVLGGILVVASALVSWHCMAYNPFLSSWARIQDDRAQTVVQNGLYQYVRHPLYLTIIIQMASVCLLLGSWWALIFAGLIAILYIQRTLLEDRMLLRELRDYPDYARRVRYRLVPGVW